MRICIISENKFDCGASIAAFRLAERLAELGHEVYYIYNFHDLPSSIKSDKINFIRVNLSPVISFLLKLLFFVPRYQFKHRLFLNYIQTKKIIKKISPDVLNFHNVARMLGRDFVVSLSLKYPSIWTMHDCWAVKNYHYSYLNSSGKDIATYSLPKDYISENTISKMLLSTSNIQFVVPSKWLFDITYEIINTHKKKVHLIPNIIPESIFRPEEQFECREYLDLSYNKIYGLFVANNIENNRKNINVLLEAVRKTQDLPIEWIALGDCHPEISKLHPHIKFYGKILSPAILQKFYSAADFFVISSIVDNLPNTVLESLFCGTPVIGANSGGIPEMVVPGKTGWLFDPYSSDQLASLIRQIFKQKDLLALTTEKCRNWMLKYFMPEIQVKRYIDIFHESIACFHLEG